MNTYRRQGRLKLLFICFAVLTFHGSAYSWPSGKGSGIASENRNSPTKEKTNYTTQGEKEVPFRANTVPNRDENETFTIAQEVYRPTPKMPIHGRRKASSVLQDIRQEDETTDLNQLKFWFTGYSEHHRKPRDTGSATDLHDLKNLTCPPRLSCLGAQNCTTEMDPGRDSKYDRCFCDKYCEMFQDCCADYAQACINTTRHLKMSENEEDWWQCHQENSSAKSVRMISFCPPSNNIPNVIRENCSNSVQTDIKDIVPVKDTKGISYRNRFCALCHGISANETQFYVAELSCNNTVVTIEISNTTSNTYANCSYLHWKLPETFPRRYCLKAGANESCSLQAAFLKAKCATSIPGIVSDYRMMGQYYLNQYCALCSNVSLFRCGPDFFNDDKKKTPPAQNAPAEVMSVTREHSSQEHVVSCGREEVYDVITRICRKILDLDLTSLAPFLYRYTAVIVLRSLVPLSKNRVSYLKEAVREVLMSNELLLLNMKVTYQNNTVYSVDIAFFPNAPISEDELNSTINLALSFNITTANNSFVTLTKSWKPIFCFKIDTYKPGEYTLMTRSYYSAVYINSTGDVIPPIHYLLEDFDKDKIKDGSFIPEGNIQVCRRTQSNCSGVFIGLKEHEYVILPNISLYRNQTGETMDFLMLNGTAYICVDYSSYYKTKAKQAKSRKLLDLLSFIGLCVSLPCLVLVLLTYSLVKELRTGPGVNLMNLTLSLLLTHILLFGIKASHIIVLCTAIAVLLHYLYLVTFTWMSIIAFDTYRTFSRTCYSRQRANKSRLTALGWLPAFVFVVTCFNLDISGKAAIGYCDDEYCWISNPHLNLFLFVIPVAFLVVFNVFVYILIVYWIQKVKKQTRNVVNSPSNLKHVWLFVKLATLMGFTWIFGFLRILWSDYFAYPFVIFTSLEGVYIMAAFVFTPRIKNMYRDLFISKKTAPVETYDTRL